MSSLQRYKKSGGFHQLLSLIETFGPQKKEKFLEMIEAESAAWSNALREKMITLERIFGWPDQVVVEVVKRLPVKSQAYAMQGLKDDQKAKILPFYSSGDQRRLADVMTENQPKPEEVQAILFKLVEVARKMIQDRELFPDKFDPALTIPEDFESKIENTYGSVTKSWRASTGETTSAAAAAAEAVLANTQVAAGDTHASAEVLQLQRTMSTLLKENKTLKDEVKALQSRLDGIKKLAA